jgi:hypothetical protein
MWKRVHSTDEAKGPDEYGYTAKILEDEAYRDLKIEVDLPFADANLCVEEPIRRFYVSDDIGTCVSDYQCRKQSGGYSRFCSPTSVNDS